MPTYPTIFLTDLEQWILNLVDFTFFSHRIGLYIQDFSSFWHLGTDGTELVDNDSPWDEEEEEGGGEKVGAEEEGPERQWQSQINGDKNTRVR